tara:strand:- start:585 stop:725 length:141 start_codon:yes stop_codon:yes gene_type:complete
MDMISIMIIIFLLIVYAYGRFYLALIEDDKIEEYLENENERGNGHD